MKRILILSRGNVGTHMSSPGIRAYYMAQVLAKALPDAQITLGIPNRKELPGEIPNVRVVPCGMVSSYGLVAESDIVISSGFAPQFALQFPNTVFVADLFSQYFMEWMEVTKGQAQGARRTFWMNQNLAYLRLQLALADFILCANERQRDTYVGMLSAMGLISPSKYDSDDSLRRLIDVAPHGVRPDDLVHERRVMKGVIPGIRETDTVVLWNSGTVHWYDPEPLLRALHILSRERDDIKALFLGAAYPGIAGIGKGVRFQSALDLSKELGLYERSVFFETGWVAFEDVKDYLLESDLSVCTYFENMETRYSYRTRFMDVFWAELPLICTRGDVLASMVEERTLGVVVPPKDTDAVLAALRRLIDDRAFYQQCRDNLAKIKPELTWERALEPLVRFCREGRSSAMPRQERFGPVLSHTAEYLRGWLIREVQGIASLDDDGLFPSVSLRVKGIADFISKRLDPGSPGGYD